MSKQKNQSGTRSIEKQVEINAPVEAVWKTLTDTMELTNWFPLEAGENPDGTLWIGWRDEFKFSSRVAAREENKFLRTVPLQSIAEKPSGDQPAITNEDFTDAALSQDESATEFHLQSLSKSTNLRLVQTGISADAEWDELYDGIQRGWDFQLFCLKLYLEKHAGTKRHVAYVRVLRDKLSREKAWDRLTGPDFLACDGQIVGLQPGDVYSFKTSIGDLFEGKVVFMNPPKDFAVTVKNLNDGLLRVQLDELFGYRDLTFFLSTYGIQKTQVDALEQRIRSLFQNLLADR